MPTRVSAIILTHNRSHLLPQAIKSVLSQTFGDFELIVVDDASEDKTAEVVQSFRDPRVRYLCNPTNMGEGRSRNVGLRAARGDYIGFLDDDDEWLPRKLERQLALFDTGSEETGAVYTGTIDVDMQTGQVLRRSVPSARGPIFDELIKKNFLSTSSVLTARRCFETVGEFDLTIPAGLDFDMWLRIAHVFQYEYAPEALVKHGIHQKRLTGDACLQIEGMRAVTKKYASYFAANPKSVHNAALQLTTLHLLNGHAAEARRLCVKYLKNDPMFFKLYLTLALSLLRKERLAFLADLHYRLKLKMFGTL